MDSRTVLINTIDRYFKKRLLEEWHSFHSLFAAHYEFALFEDTWPLNRIYIYAKYSGENYSDYRKFNSDSKDLCQLEWVDLLNIYLFKAKLDIAIRKFWDYHIWLMSLYSEDNDSFIDRKVFGDECE